MDKDIKAFYLIRAFKVLFGGITLLSSLWGAGDWSTEHQQIVCLGIDAVCIVVMVVLFALGDKVGRRLAGDD